MKITFLSTVAMSALAVAVSRGTPVSADQDDTIAIMTSHDVRTATPIKHLVVIFNENARSTIISRPTRRRRNPPGEIPFTAHPRTPKVNNLANADLLTNNPNLTNTANGTGAGDPFRLDLTQADTADQNHAYTAEQEAEDNGKADLFPKFTGRAPPAASVLSVPPGW